MEATFTPQEAFLIWEALEHGQPQMMHYDEPRARHAEAMKVVAAELRKVGVFPPLPKHPSDSRAAA